MAFILLSRFCEQRGSAILVYAAELTPILESERTSCNIQCANLVEKSLALAKVAARVAWGIRSSLDVYDDTTTDFKAILKELVQAFDTVSDAVRDSRQMEDAHGGALSPAVHTVYDGDVSDSSSETVSKHASLERLGLEDLDYLGAGSDDISPAQIIRFSPLPSLDGSSPHSISESLPFLASKSTHPSALATATHQESVEILSQKLAADLGDRILGCITRVLSDDIKKILYDQLAIVLPDALRLGFEERAEGTLQDMVPQ
ncbi:hypothetical protein BN946_scf184910.g23 [Trametes cinnabarina]|uniref:Uncharacterized protein n=1 Tax=Pycnoporus cinnabarinus TaxID=5643 RepID=A0A060SH09_PYCCI|nr:hypothetical protein BN946_scf184910.g23 [Trametes cinnabarina]